MKFVAKKRQEETLEIEFPDGEKRTFQILGRDIANQRKAITLFNKMKSADMSDPTQSTKALDEVLKFLFPGSSLKDFETLDMDDLVDLLRQMQSYLEGVYIRTEDEKKNQSN